MNAILARFQDEPALVDATRTAWFESCVHGASSDLARIRSQAADAGESMDSGDGDAWWGEPGSFKAMLRPYVVRDGVLQIPVKGVLLHDFPYNLFNWATGYDYIWRAFERGMADGNVRGIALIVDSPGGMVAGCFEMVDKMFAMRGVKPIAGFASESAYSAAYATISVVDPGKLYVTRTGGVGSIGVVTSHVDVSGMMDRQGVKVTFIHAGKHKVDGNPYEALAPEVKARIQARIDDLYGVFTASVARNRGIDEQAVRDTEALTFGAHDALSNGLADKIGALDDSLADFSASLLPNQKEEQMADISQAEHETALAAARTEARAEGVTEGKAAGLAEGAAAERTRINAILSSDEGKKRPKAALSCALRSDMDVDAASAFLADLAEETAASTTVVEPTAGAPKGMLDAAMRGSENPEISAEGGDAEQETNPVDLAQKYGISGFSAKAK